VADEQGGHFVVHFTLYLRTKLMQGGCLPVCQTA
jgi:hypothetical protein